MAKSSARPALPGWVLPVAIAIGVLVIGFLSYRALTGNSMPEGKPIEVRPGMYDFRAEAAKGNLGKRTGGPGFDQGQSR